MNAIDDPDRPGRRRAKDRPATSPAETTSTAIAETPIKPANASQVVILGEESKSKRKFVSDDLLGDAKNPITVAFLLTLAGGLLAEIFVTSTTAIWLAVGAMLVYFLFGLTVPKTTRNTEKFADSLYYLGFILTLMALFLAMVPSFQSAPITSVVIIEKFGIAILTTFVGMSLRIILLQLRHTATDQEEEARESVAEYVASLEQEIKNAITQIRRFRESAMDDATKSAEAFAQEMEEITKTAGQAISTSNETMIENLKHVTQSVDQAIREIVRQLENLDVPKDIFSVLRASAVALSHDVDVLSRSVSDSATAFTAALGNSVAAIAGVKNNVDVLGQLITSVSNELTTMAKISAENNRTFAAAADQAGQSMQRIRQEASALVGALQELKVKLNECGTKYEDDLGGATAQIRAAAVEIKADADAFSGTLVGSARLIRDALQGVKRNE